MARSTKPDGLALGSNTSRIASVATRTKSSTERIPVLVVLFTLFARVTAGGAALTPRVTPRGLALGAIPPIDPGLNRARHPDMTKSEMSLSEDTLQSHFGARRPRGWG